MNQADFGASVGVSRNSQANYEADKRLPDAAYLAIAMRAGVDVLFVLTGERGFPAEQLFSARELALLRAFRSATDAGRAAIEATASALAASASYGPAAVAKHQTTFHGSVGAVHTVHEGRMSVSNAPAKRVRKPPVGGG